MTSERTSERAKSAPTSVPQGAPLPTGKQEGKGTTYALAIPIGSLPIERRPLAPVPWLPNRDAPCTVAVEPYVPRTDPHSRLLSMAGQRVGVGGRVWEEGGDGREEGDRGEEEGEDGEDDMRPSEPARPFAGRREGGRRGGLEEARAGEGPRQRRGRWGRRVHRAMVVGSEQQGPAGL